MITIPEYHYKDDAFEFVCPALELQRGDAHQMLTALTKPTWSSTLREMEYICHAMAALGFNSQVVSDALADRYDCTALDGCVSDSMGGDLDEVLVGTNKIRAAWCDHMRTHLKQALS